MIYHLRKKVIIILSIIYSIIILIGIGTSSYTLLQPLEELSKKQIIQYTLLSALPLSMATSSMQYIRRLYKACIENRIESDMEPIKMIGNILYFLTRPLFSALFSLLFIVLLSTGLLVIGGSVDIIVNENYLYTCVMASSVIGFEVGGVLDYYKRISKSTVSRFEGDNSDNRK